MPGSARDLTDLAAAVADGGTPDWSSAESSAADERTRAVIARLRSIAEIARVHGAADGSDASVSGWDVPSVGPAAVTDVPATWGSLRILERVGSGRFGDVYRAFDPSLDREVALKILRHRTATPALDDTTPGLDDEDAALVIEEGRLAARVRHPNVVTIYGAQRIGDRTGIWMEFVEGRTLEAELADRGPFAAAAVAEAGIELARALAAVHEAGLVHRDVKATNVMRDRRGRVVLGDFGTGRDLEDSGQALRGLAGTPAYLAPEIFAHQPATPASDLYSLGVLLFHLATGGYPVHGRTLAEIRRAHESSERGDVRSTGLPEPVAAVIEKLTQVDPAKRPARAGEVEAALSLWLQRTPGGRSRAARLTAAVAAGLIGTVVVGLMGWQAGWFTRVLLPFEARDWVLVIPVDNRTGNPLLDGPIEAGLERELAVSAFVNIVPRDRVEDSLRLMALPADTRLDRAIGREVALRDGGIAALVAGGVDKVGAAYRLTFLVINPADAAIVASFVEDAAGESGVLQAVRRQALALRAALGEATQSIRADREELERVTTPSIRALQLYSQAVSLYNAGRYGAAEQLLEEATGEDPRFASALALRSMALLFQNQGRPPSDYLPLAEEAVRQSAAASPVEQNFAVANLYYLRARATDPARGRANLEKAAERYQAVLALQSDHLWAAEFLRIVYIGLGRRREAEDIQVLLADRRPRHFEVNVEAAQILLGRGDVAVARRYNERAANAFLPDELLRAQRQAQMNMAVRSVAVRLFEANAAWLEQDAAGALAAVDAAASRAGEILPEERTPFAIALTWLYLTLGRYGQAEEAAALSATPNSRNVLRASVLAERGDIDGLRKFLTTEYRETVDPARADDLIRAGLIAEAGEELRKLPKPARPRPVEARLMLAQGRSREAIEVLNSWLVPGPGPTNFNRGRLGLMFDLARAWEMEGDVQRAIDVLLAGFSRRADAATELTTGRSSGYIWIRGRAELARLLRDTGRTREAEAVEAELRPLLAVADSDLRDRIRTRR